MRSELKDAIQEIINIGLGKAAAMLNKLLKNHILLEIPQVTIIPFSEVTREFGLMHLTPVSAVRLCFKGSINGVSSLVFPPDSASKLVDLLVGEENFSEDMDGIKIGTLSEVGNIILNSVMASFSNTLETRLIYTIPAYIEGDISAILRLEVERDALVISAKTRFTVESQEIEGEIFLLFELGSFDILSRAVDAAINS